MKPLHQSHLTALLALFLGGMYLVYRIEESGGGWAQDFLPSSWAFQENSLSTWALADSQVRVAALWGGLTFLLTALVGARSRQHFPKLGYSMLGFGVLGALGHLVWHFKPTLLQYQEFFPIWVLYVGMGVWGSAYVLLKTTSMESELAVPMKDNLLDDYL